MVSHPKTPILNCFYHFLWFYVLTVSEFSLLVHGGCPPASITQKRPNHGQVSVHGERKFIEGQQPYVQ